MLPVPVNATPVTNIHVSLGPGPVNASSPDALDVEPEELDDVATPAAAVDEVVVALTEVDEVVVEVVAPAEVVVVVPTVAVVVVVPTGAVVVVVDSPWKKIVACALSLAKSPNDREHVIPAACSAAVGGHG